MRELEKNAHLLPVKSTDFNPALYRQDLRGSYIARLQLKQLNRRCEVQLYIAQSLQACGGINSTVALDGMWKGILLNQFHDTLGGTCIDDVYLGAKQRYCDVLEGLSELKCFTSGENDKEVRVWNPYGFEVSGYVRVPTICTGNIAVHIDGKETICEAIEVDGKRHIEFFCEALPAFGEKRYRIAPGSNTNPARIQNAFTLQNEYYGVMLDECSGQLMQIYDKKNAKNLIIEGSDANVIVGIYEDNPDMEGQLNFTDRIVCDGDARCISIKTEKSSIEEKCVVVLQMEEFTWKKTVSLKRGINRVDFVSEVVDYEGGDLFILSKFDFDV